MVTAGLKWAPDMDLKDEINTKVLPCTLITKDKEFELGNDLVSSKKKVFLNHPFCSQFCILGNSSCS